MKKTISFFVCLMMIFSLGIQNVHGETVYEADHEQAREDNVMLKVTGHHSTLGDEECLKQINLMRYRACRHEEVNPDDESKKEKLSLKTDYGETPTTDELSQSNGDYVPMKWSNELERVAEIRSVEACLCDTHVRPNATESEYMNKVILDGKDDWSNAENLAWYGDMQKDLNGWASERSLYVQNPQANENYIGHYTNMIAPSNNYVGLSTFSATDLDGNQVECTALEGGDSELAFYNDVSYTTTARNLNEDCSQKVEVEAAACDFSLHVDDVLHYNKTQQGQVYAEYRCPFTGTTTKWPVVSRILWSSTDEDVFKVSPQGMIAAGDHDGDAELQALVTNKLLAKTIKIGHNWFYEEGKTDVAATCVSEGKKYLKCSICGDLKEEAIPIDPNAHGEIKLENKKAATCTENGYTGDQVCQLCKKVIKAGHVINAKGHHFVRYNTGDTSYMLVCSRCGETQYFNINSDDHKTPSDQANDHTKTVVPPAQDNKGNNKNETSKENSQTVTHTHSYKWVVDQQGNSSQECTICGKKVYPQVASLLNLTLKASSNKMKISFKKVNGASQYTLYRAINGTKFKKYKTVKTNRFTDRKLKKHMIYGYMVMANDGKKTKSLKCYSVTGNSKGKQANVRNLTTSKAVKIKAGQKKKLKVKVSYYGNKKKPLNKRFGGTLRYVSNKKAIATVNKNGTVTGIRAGFCNIFVYGQNGLYKTVKVMVKG